MIAVDTNLIVRLLAKDDLKQTEQARGLMLNSKVYVTETVFLEAEWVLRHTYKFSRTDIVNGLRLFIRQSNVFMADIIAVDIALDWHEQGLDFADALHLAISQHCTQFVTFDRKFARRSQHLNTIPVTLPNIP